jgi:chromosome segregation ATPase
MSVEMLTYNALAARLDISAEAARGVVRRWGLPRSLSSDGKARVTVDVDEIRHRRRAPAGRAAKIDALETELARLATTLALQRAEYECERARADRLAAELAGLAAEIMSVKQATSGLESELVALRTAVQKQPPTRLGRLTASLVENDRRACR